MKANYSESFFFSFIWFGTILFHLTHWKFSMFICLGTRNQSPAIHQHHPQYSTSPFFVLYLPTNFRTTLFLHFFYSKWYYYRYHHFTAAADFIASISSFWFLIIDKLPFCLFPFFSFFSFHSFSFHYLSSKCVFLGAISTELTAVVVFSLAYSVNVGSQTQDPQTNSFWHATEQFSWLIFS